MKLSLKLSLNTLLALKLAAATKDGKLVVCCSSICVIRCTYKGKELRIVDGAITITLLGDLKSIAPEQLCDHGIDLVVEVDPKRSRNVQVKTMAGLSSAPKQDAIQAPVLKDGKLTATICVSSTHASSFPVGAVIVGMRSGCTIARLTVNVADILVGDDMSLCLQSTGLKFTFHRDIAEKAMVLLNQAHEEAPEREGQLIIQQLLADCAQRAKEDAERCKNVAKATASPVPYNTFDGRDVISPVPTLLPRNVEATALSGIVIAPSRKEQKALEKAERDAQKAQRDAEKDKRLEEKRKANEEEEARRLQDLADIACVEHMKAEAWRNQNATNAVQPVAQEEAGQPQVWGKTFRKDVVINLEALAKKHRLSLSVVTRQYTNGLMYFIDVSALLAAGILTLRVSAWGNEIVIGQPTDDGTHLWGTCVNVDHESYGEIVAMFPEMDITVCQVMETRTALKVQKPHPCPQQNQYQHHQPVMWVPYPMVMNNQQSAYPLYA